ncbi:MAG: hypothetical protein HC771_13370 [Synechococcales cyanobacterium CRU_2_2]|nr:hypothetical protein [Synechococcales cyanobacterium CRU_2_2]
MSRYAVLLGEIERELKDLAMLAQRTEALLTKLRVTEDQDYLGSLALNLHGFYSGCERIFQDVALTVDDALPNQKDWHRRLLRQMATEIPQVRPAVLGEESLKGLNELCAFRHVVRNVYSFDLLPERVQGLAAELSLTYGELEENLKRFCEFLARVNRSG